MSLCHCGQQLEAAQRQHADLSKNISGKAVTVHIILLGVGGTCYTEHILNQFKHLGLDHQRAITLARKLHAHFFMYANKLVTTRRAIENTNTSYSQVLGPASRWRRLMAHVRKKVVIIRVTILIRFVIPPGIQNRGKEGFKLYRLFPSDCVCHATILTSAASQQPALGGVAVFSQKHGCGRSKF
eukprot:1157731-Pelagomonas_calceolata.AAC.3